MQYTTAITLAIFAGIQQSLAQVQTQCFSLQVNYNIVPPYSATGPFQETYIQTIQTSISGAEDALGPDATYGPNAAQFTIGPNNLLFSNDEKVLYVATPATGTQSDLTVVGVVPNSYNADFTPLQCSVNQTSNVPFLQCFAGNASSTGFYIKNDADYNAPPALHVGSNPQPGFYQTVPLEVVDCYGVN